MLSGILLLVIQYLVYLPLPVKNDLSVRAGRIKTKPSVRYYSVEWDYTTLLCYWVDQCQETEQAYLTNGSGQKNSEVLCDDGGKVYIVAAVVVLTFVLCWLPFHTGRILFAWAGGGGEEKEEADEEEGEREAKYYHQVLSQYFNLITMVLFYLSASINPVLYNIMSQKYRAAMSKIFSRGEDQQCRNLPRSEQSSLEGTEMTYFM
ncbi:uncharacterized protein LOC130291945 [Hyla sarda]|uniref:uncharacterized protein LOC130291945 n=1 Tax=Hyla sarda TaxID=327740 RepID=UPI0024C21B7B|nr:uncharacterized protein LOC130291945 [Hyla sarda]